jgi:hypothetical protein
LAKEDREDLMWPEILFKGWHGRRSGRYEPFKGKIGKLSEANIRKKYGYLEPAERWGLGQEHRELRDHIQFSVEPEGVKGWE